jgi:hypothetical protein
MVRCGSKIEIQMDWKLSHFKPADSRGGIGAQKEVLLQGTINYPLM